MVKRPASASERATGPGPGSYTPGKYAQHHRPAAFSFGSPSTPTLSRHAPTTPGPGSYTPSLSTKYKPSAFSMGRPQTSKPRKATPDSPGPAAYSPTDVNKHRSAAFGMGKPHPSKAAVVRASHSPGPGAYSPSEIAVPHWPKFSIGRDVRRNARPDDTPGPGSYDSQPVGATRSAAWKLRPTDTSRSMATGEATPGPGTYFEASERGEPYSEITRTGQKMLSKKSAAWARQHKVGATNPRFLDDPF